MAHKFSIGETVKLPGRQFKFTGTGFANKFMWDATGTVEDLGYTKPRMEAKVVSGGEEVYVDGKLHHFTSIQTAMVEVPGKPMYKVNGKWLHENHLAKAN